jgi:hypothetical protein
VRLGHVHQADVGETRDRFHTQQQQQQPRPVPDVRGSRGSDADAGAQQGAVPVPWFKSTPAARSSNEVVESIFEALRDEAGRPPPPPQPGQAKRALAEETSRVEKRFVFSPAEPAAHAKAQRILQEADSSSFRFGR